MQIHWLTQKQEQIPQGYDWLHPAEKEFLNGLKFKKRRDDWLLGRWTGKKVIQAYFKLVHIELPFYKIEIRKAEDGAPEVFFEGNPLDCIISLSHSHRVGFCTIGPKGIKLGCDLEKIEPRSPHFINDYFTKNEKAFLNLQSPTKRPFYANLIWSAKESVMKSLRTGLSLDTKRISIDFPISNPMNNWIPFNVKIEESSIRIFGNYFSDNSFVYTVSMENPFSLNKVILKIS